MNSEEMQKKIKELEYWNRKLIALWGVYLERSRKSDRYQFIINMLLSFSLVCISMKDILPMLKSFF